MPVYVEKDVADSTQLRSILSSSPKARATKRCKISQIRRRDSCPGQLESYKFGDLEDACYLPPGRLNCEMKLAINRSLRTRSSMEIAAEDPRTIFIPRITKLKGTNRAVLKHSRVLLPRDLELLHQHYPPFPDHVYRQVGECLAREYLTSPVTADKAPVGTLKRSNSLTLEIMKDIGLKDCRAKRIIFKPEPIVPPKSPRLWRPCKPWIVLIDNEWDNTRKQKRSVTANLSKTKPVGLLMLPFRFDDLSHSMILDELLKVNPLLADHPESTSLDSYFYTTEVERKEDYDELLKRALNYLDKKRPMDAYPDKDDWEIHEIVQEEERNFLDIAGEFFDFSMFS